MNRRGTFLWVALVSAWISATSALAQPKPPEADAAKKAAVEEAKKAKTAFDAGSYEEAITGYRKADELAHTPRYLVEVARAQTKLRKLVEAKSTYEKILAEPLPDGAAPELADAHKDARTELEAVTTRIPTMRINVRGGGAAGATVTLDGAPFPTASLGEPMFHNPGPHTIVVSPVGQPEVTKSVDLQEGTAESVTIEVSPLTPPTPTNVPTAAPSVSATASAAPTGNLVGDVSGHPVDEPPPTNPPFSGKVPLTTYIAYGVGGAGLIVGAALGGASLQAQSEFLANPNRSKAEQGRRLTVGADIGFVVAVAGGALGTILWARAPLAAPAPKSGIASPVSSVQITPFAGPACGGVVASGRF